MLPVSEVSVVVKVSYSLVVYVAHWSKLLDSTFKSSSRQVEELG